MNAIKNLSTLSQQGIAQLVELFHLHSCGQRLETPRHPINIGVNPSPAIACTKKKKKFINALYVLSKTLIMW